MLPNIRTCIPSGTTATDEPNTNTASNAIDMNNNTSWNPQYQQSMLDLNFRKAEKINRVTIKYAPTYMENFQMFISIIGRERDGSWIDLAENINVQATAGIGIQERRIDVYQGYYQGIRIYLTSYKFVKIYEVGVLC
jgi:hypothetical protein